MFRFYCSVCNKIKRVQKRPVSIENADHGNPSMRIGVCNRHYAGASNKGFNKLNLEQAIGRSKR